MPLIGLGLHFLIAIFFAIHAVRNRRQLYWLLILFSFPLLGSLAYFVANTCRPRVSSDAAAWPGGRSRKVSILAATCARLGARST